MKEKIDRLISKMTIEQKLGQLTQEFVTNDRFDELKALAEKESLVPVF